MSLPTDTSTEKALGLRTDKPHELVRIRDEVGKTRANVVEGHLNGFQ